MTRVTRHLALAVLVLALGSSARADTILFSTTYTRSTTYCCAPFATSAQLYWGVYQPEAPLNQTVPLFENQLFTAADIGVTFAADSTSDPDFPYIVSVLTNGLDDSQMNFALLSPEGTGLVDGALQSDFFAGLEPRFGPDLFGYDVRRITFTIEHLAFLPTDEPDQAGKIEGRFTYGFEGDAPPIPEPATVTLLATGLGALAVRRRGARR
jgi:PEP-CTERM motif-containing protein